MNKIHIDELIDDELDRRVNQLDEEEEADMEEDEENEPYEDEEEREEEAGVDDYLNGKYYEDVSDEGWDE